MTDVLNRYIAQPVNKILVQDLWLSAITGCTSSSEHWEVFWIASHHTADALYPLWNSLPGMID